MRVESKANSLSLGTHDGAFHCDDCCAIAQLRSLPRYANATVVRTRDAEELAKCEVVVDVGGIYDPERLRFDHHQRGFDVKFPGRDTTKLSSAGMVWLHFGKEILKEVWEVDNDENVNLLHTKLYINLFESIDALDNGVNICDGEPKFLLRTDLTSRIARLNLDWQDPRVDHLCAKEFTDGVELATVEINDQIRRIIRLWLPAREIVESAMKNRNKVHNSNRVIELEQQCPWEEHLEDMETQMGLTGDATILFVFHKGWGDDWRVRAVRKSRTSFGSRLELPEKFRGLRDEDLKKIPEADGINFVHIAGFLGGCKNRDAALRLIDLAIAEM